jgi:glucose-1-phosphate thymidylyltransferase
VKLDDKGAITDFVEKPETFISDLAIIGIYYFKDGEYLKKELQYLIDNNIKDKGEYQLTNALDNMKNKGSKFLPGKVEAWLDCGNKDSTVDTNMRYMDYLKDQNLVSKSAKVVNSVIIPPVYIGDNAEISNTVIGPYVSVGNGTKISDSIVKKSIIQEKAVVKNANINNSMLGSFASYEGRPADLSVGDYNVIIE